MRTLLLIAMLAGCGENTCIDKASGVDTCQLCLAKPLSCGANEFVLTWGCHYPPSANPTTRSCEPVPAACASDRSCTCLKASFDAGVNCSPGLGATCITDGGTLELYCSPP